MKTTLPVDEFLGRHREGILLDVRSPSEYREGHIPGAISFPLFEDSERAEIGTLYKQTGKNEAILRGLDIVGPKMSSFVSKAMELSGGRPVFLYCWRGGMRSGSMRILLGTAGLACYTLTGGYKSFRKKVLGELEYPWNFRVIGGKTGSGKTLVLQAMANLGAQVVDLESMARHKGSAFGGLGELPQPGNELFTNQLYSVLNTFDKNRIVWIEDESQMIGQVCLPSPFYKQLRQSPLYVLDIPLEERINNLLGIYGESDVQQISEAFQRIRKKLGGQHLNTALEMIHQGDKRGAASIALRYYDKAYAFGLENKDTVDIRVRAFDKLDPVFIARELLIEEP